MRKIYLFLSIFILVSLACDLAVNVASPVDPAASPTNTTVAALLPTNTMIPTLAPPTQIPASATSIPATLAPNPTSTALGPSREGVEVSAGPLSIVLQPGIASGVRGSQFARADGPELPYWSLTPGHTQLKLEGYVLQGKSHEPQIYVYPALEYAEMVPGAFESIHRLDNILYSPGGPAINDELPAVPFFNSQQAFASNIQLVSFQNGQGVRFLTEYAQYAVSANNHELFYHFEGVTRNGAYYIVAVLPITAPVLAETSDGGAPLPPGGIPYSYFADPHADMRGYYAAVTDLLNSTAPDAFTPTISKLDALIESMRVTP